MGNHGLFEKALKELKEKTSRNEFWNPNLYIDSAIIQN